jgi:hypothetical protein
MFSEIEKHIAQNLAIIIFTGKKLLCCPLLYVYTMQPLKTELMYLLFTFTFNAWPHLPPFPPNSLSLPDPFTSSLFHSFIPSSIPPFIHSPLHRVGKNPGLKKPQYLIYYEKPNKQFE